VTEAVSIEWDQDGWTQDMMRLREAVEQEVGSVVKAADVQYVLTWMARETGVLDRGTIVIGLDSRDTESLRLLTRHLEDTLGVSWNVYRTKQVLERYRS
jgi:hypothetical protein